MRLLGRFLRDERGATAVEYALLAIAVSLAIVIAVDLTGTNARDGVYTDMGTLF